MSEHELKNADAEVETEAPETLQRRRMFYLVGAAAAVNAFFGFIPKARAGTWKRVGSPGGSNNNLVYAGPTSGGPTAPTFRALVQADLPAQPYVISFFYPDQPAGSAIMGVHVATETVSISSSLTGSQGYAETAATAQTDIDVQKNGVSVGTVRFAAAGQTPTFIAASAVSLAPGDRLKLVYPASPDATLANIAISIRGTR